MPPTRSLRDRKKQTRLTFQSISSSSPTKTEYSDAVHSRLANVRVEGMKGGHQPSAVRDDDEQSLPTPQPSSPIAVQSQFIKSSSPLSSLRTSPSLPPRFINADNQPSTDDDEEIIPPSSKRRRISNVNRERMTGNTKSVVARTEPLDNASPTSTILSSSSLDMTFSTPIRRSTRLAKDSPTQRSGLSSSSQKLVPVNAPVFANRNSNLGSAESSGDDVMATQPTTRRRAAKQKLSKEDTFVVADDELEFVSSEYSAPRAKKSKRQRRSDDFVVQNDEIEYITSGEEETQGEVMPLKLQRLSKRQESPKSSERHVNQRSKREREELAEDLLDLQDSEHETSVRDSRTRGGPVTTQRDKTREHFELLKQRRAGKRPARVITSDDDDADDDDTDDDHHGVSIESIGNDTNHTLVISDDENSLIGENGQEAVYMDDEDDFVVDDQAVTAGRLGRPNTDIPLQFTSFASAKPRDMFPHIVEWMVKNKISPAFNRDDDVYNMSFSRIDDQVKAQAGSRLISSAWNATFKYAMLARPGMTVHALPGLDEDLIRTCDACNKSNHPARYDFLLSGKAYSKDTLEPINDSDDETDEDAADGSASYDQEGHVLASTNMHFYLGRYCAANAEMGHKLTHWKHHLNEQILSYLEEQGVLSAETIVSREKLNKKKREKEAESIVDMMQDTGMISELWQSFKDDLEDARIGMEGHERKGGRSKARIGSVRVKRADGAVGDWNEGGKFRQLPTQLRSDSEGE